MQKILQHKSWWLFLVIAFAGIAYVSSLFTYRIDLTKEKRFSLSNPTIDLLNNLDTPVTVHVFLTGDLPSDYKKLSTATEDLLRQMRDLSGNNVRYVFEKPGEGLADTSRDQLLDSLARMGVVIENSEAISSAKDKATSQMIFPSALVYYKNLRPMVIDLRSSRKIFKPFNVINQLEPQEDVEATRNAAEALLEYKFANAIEKLSRKSVPTIAYLIGNGEPGYQTVTDLVESLRNDYRLGIFDLKQAFPNPSQVNAMLIVKPTQPFTQQDKLKIDQYVMHGGKILWFVDKLYAELDSLMHNQNGFVAFDRNLNLDDLLFKYGVRINGDLLQDLNCAKIPLVYGKNPDGSPKMQRHPWRYYPFVSAPNNNGIAKNLERVLPIFPSSIDTVKAPGIKKTILLATDTNSRSLSSPAMVTVNGGVKDEADFQTFNRSHFPVAVLLEGKFNSLFANRLTTDLQDSLKLSGVPFASSSKETQQIVASDADLVTNAVSETQGPLPMGMIPFENYRFGNREFFLNCIDYLVGNSGIFQTRNKEFTLRLLDKAKVEEEKTKWQFINVAGPVAVVLIFGMIFLWRRKQQYGV
ncbi:MAG: gldG [Chitinophagaceae bacterium]|nr:gldG [Chitinophagaceae bacterium]